MQEDAPTPRHRCGVQIVIVKGGLKGTHVPCHNKTCPNCHDKWKADRLDLLSDKFNVNTGRPIRLLHLDAPTWKKGNWQKAFRRQEGGWLAIPRGDNYMVITDAPYGTEFDTDDVYELASVALGDLGAIASSRIAFGGTWRQPTKPKRPGTAKLAAWSPGYPAVLAEKFGVPHRPLPGGGFEIKGNDVVAKAIAALLEKPLTTNSSQVKCERLWRDREETQ
jgi:hypothetical protein